MVQMRKPGKKKSYLTFLLKGPLPEVRVNALRLKWWLMHMCFAFAIFHALFEVRSLLRDPIPAFEQLETAEGYIKTLDQAKSSFRIVVVITPRGNIGGYYPWWPCTLQSKDWASQFEGKKAKVWYVNERIVQLQLGDHIDSSCQYSNSVQIDDETKQTAIRAFVLDFVVLFIGIYLAVSACKQYRLSTSA